MVDILLATYNGEDFLGEQIDSILNQTYQDVRILIRDDGSSDDTLEIIQSYVNRYPQKILLIKEDSKYKCSANNFMILLKHAASDYVMFCDQDDVWLPNKVATSLNEIKNIESREGNNTPILVFGEYNLVDEKLNALDDIKGNQIEKYKVDVNHLLVQNYVTGCLIMINKALYSNIGDYSPEITMHDWWLALYAASFGIIHHFDDKIMLYRQHHDNVVGAVNVKSMQYRLNKLFSPKTKEMKWVYKRQAEKFINDYGDSLPSKVKKIYADFISIFNEKRKIKRIYMLCKGRYLKSDFVRALGQMFYI